MKGLLDPGYLAERAELIDPETAAEGEAEAGDPPHREGRLHAPDPGLGSPGTTHLVAIDADGLALSITASIETAFGSGRMAEGFLLNNQLTDFSFLPAEEDGTPIANAAAAGKRPRSSMAPTIVYAKDAPERPAVLAGSPGGGSGRRPCLAPQSRVGRSRGGRAFCGSGRGAGGDGPHRRDGGPSLRPPHQPAVAGRDARGRRRSAARGRGGD